MEEKTYNRVFAYILNQFWFNMYDLVLFMDSHKEADVSFVCYVFYFPIEPQHYIAKLNAST